MKNWLGSVVDLYELGTITTKVFGPCPQLDHLIRQDRAGQISLPEWARKVLPGSCCRRLTELRPIEQAVVAMSDGEETDTDQGEMDTADRRT